MKILLLACLLFFSIDSQAQTKSDLTGKWTIVKVYKIALAPPEELQQLDAFISNNWTMEFREDGVMVASPGNTTQVTTWEFDEPTKKLVLKSEGKTLPVNIIQFEPNKMHISMSLENRVAEFGMQKK